MPTSSRFDDPAPSAGHPRAVLFLSVWFALTLLAASCGRPPAATQLMPVGQSPALPTAASGLTNEQLLNATFNLPDAPGGAITLAGGEGQVAAAPNSASMYKVILHSPAAFGDLDGADGADAAAVLVADPGGSGSFYYLVALLDQDGSPLHAASALLGDRIKVKSVSIADGQIRVVYLDRQPGEPFTTEPSLEVTKDFRLQDGQLEEVIGK